MPTPTPATIHRLNRLGKRLGDYQAALSRQWTIVNMTENTTEYQHFYTGLSVNLWHDMSDGLNGFDDQVSEDA